MSSRIPSAPATCSSFYDAMSDDVERHGGTIEKFAGDAVMAAFGAPAALEDHAEPDSVQAVLAARIDLLPEVEKEALQAAAVIGRTFWTGPGY